MVVIIVQKWRRWGLGLADPADLARATDAGAPDGRRRRERSRRGRSDILDELDDGGVSGIPVERVIRCPKGTSNRPEN